MANISPHSLAIPNAIQIKCTFEPLLGSPSERTAAIGTAFGIPLFGSTVVAVENTAISLRPGEIVLLLGPSGSGKSSILNTIQDQFTAVRRVERITFSDSEAIIDQIVPRASLQEAVSILTTCGLGQPHLWIRRFAELSEGERFRARLSKAIALQTRAGTPIPLLCDEFCSMLHRRAARAISFNLRKLVTRYGLCLVVASSNSDILSDLQPNHVVHLQGQGRCASKSLKTDSRRPFSLIRRLKIEPGGKRDYDAFAAMHYRATDELGFVDKVFILRSGKDPSPLGIVVYSHGALELSLRNKATDKRFSRNPVKLNCELRVLRRLVIHPDVRGCGLGHYLVRRTLPMVGTPYIECLATMGAYNPVFEKAGMVRIGQYDLTPRRRNALDELQSLDVDPFSRDFPLWVARSRRVRRIVAKVVYDWYAATTARGERRVQRQSPQFLAQAFRSLIGSKPVYYLWKRQDPKAKAA